MEALDSCFLDGSIHSLHLPVRPRMLHFGKAVLNVMLSADKAKNMFTSIPIT